MLRILILRKMIFASLFDSNADGDDTVEGKSFGDGYSSFITRYNIKFKLRSDVDVFY